MELQDLKNYGSQERLQALPPLIVRPGGGRTGRRGECTWDPNLERRIRRKFDRHILPWLFLLWLLAFLDRSNIGNAAVAGLDEDAHLDGTRFNTALTVFHALYMVVVIPSNWLLRKVGGGRYLPILAAAWGIVTTCMGTVKSFGGLVTCRIFLGGFEGAFFGGIILYMSMFYKRHEMMSRIGIFASGASLSGAFGGLLATGLVHIDYGGYAGWPWIFFVEGAITVSVAISAFFFLPNTPSSAKFLAGHEQWLAAHRLYIDSQGSTTVERVEQERFRWRTASFAILNVNTLLMSFNYSLILIPIYSFAIFLPTILEGMKFDTTNIQLLTVPPNILAFLCVIATALISDRIQMRGPLIMVGFTIAAIGYIIQLASSNPPVQYAGIFLIGAGVFPCSPLILTWLSNNLAPHYARATGLGFITAFGQLGAIVASFTYLEKDQPNYTTGHSISLGAIVLTIIGVAANMVYIRWENAARKAGKRDNRLNEVRRGYDLGYQHPEFRYTL